MKASILKNKGNTFGITIIAGIALLFALGVTACKDTVRSSVFSQEKFCRLEIRPASVDEPARSAHPTEFPATWFYKAKAVEDITPAPAALASAKVKLSSAHAGISLTLERGKTYIITLEAYTSETVAAPVATGSKKLTIPAASASIPQCNIVLHPASGTTEPGAIALELDFSAVTDFAEAAIESSSPSITTGITISSPDPSKKCTLQASGVTARTYDIKLALKNSAAEVIGVVYLRDITVEPGRTTKTWTGIQGVNTSYALEDKQVFKQQLFYVKSDGDDTNNNGLTADKPFKTLQHAIGKCTKEDVDYVICIIGSLTGADACGSITTGSLITIVGTGTTPTLNAGNRPESVLHIEHDDAEVVLQKITITGVEGKHTATELVSGIFIKAGTCTLDTGSIVTGNTKTLSGGGVWINGIEGAHKAHLIMKDGSKIENNTSWADGGGVNIDHGTFTMQGGEISGNRACTGTKPSPAIGNYNGEGGGVRIAHQDAVFTWENGVIRDNYSHANPDGSDTGTDEYGKDIFVGDRAQFIFDAAKSPILDSPVYLSRYEDSGTSTTYQAKITLQNFDGSYPDVVTITPAEYEEGSVLLTAGTGTTLTQTILDKFSVTNDESVEYTLELDGTNGKLKKIGAQNQTLDFTDPAYTANDKWKKLKQAVADAKDGGTITINGQIIATNDAGNNGIIEIKEKSLTIEGSNKATDIINANKNIDGKPEHGIFKIIGKVGVDYTVTIRNLTLKGGKNSATGGGAVSLHTSPKVIIENTDITANECVGRNGGGVYVGSGTCTMTGSSAITNNKAANGGGVYIDGNDAFIMTGGTISGNTATGKGAGVYVLGAFSMQGDAKVGSYSGATFDNNYVYLGIHDSNNKHINITDTLNATPASPAAVIVPGNTAGDGVDYSEKSVLSGKCVQSSNYTKFKVVDQDLTGGKKQPWIIDTTGKMIEHTEFYVKSSSAGGSDTAGYGTDYAPFATLQKAIDSCRIAGKSYEIKIMDNLNGNAACGNIDQDRTIAISSFTTEIKTLNAAGSSPGKPVLKINNSGAEVTLVGYVTLKGGTKPSGELGGSGIWLNAGTLILNDNKVIVDTGNDIYLNNASGSGAVLKATYLQSHDHIIGIITLNDYSAGTGTQVLAPDSTGLENAPKVFEITPYNDGAKDHFWVLDTNGKLQKPSTFYVKSTSTAPLHGTQKHPFRALNSAYYAITEANSTVYMMDDGTAGFLKLNQSFTLSSDDINISRTLTGDSGSNCVLKIGNSNPASITLENITVVGHASMDNLPKSGILVHKGSELILRGDKATVDPKHDIWMDMSDTANLAKLTVDGPPASGTVARITLSHYNEGDRVLSGSSPTDIANWASHFSLTDNAYSIKSDGTLKKDRMTWAQLKNAVETGSDSVITIENEIKATATDYGEITVKNGRTVTIKGKDSTTDPATHDSIYSINADCASTGQTHRIFKVESGGSLTIQDITLTGGKTPSSGSNSVKGGGAVLVQNGGTFTMNSGAVITGNTAGGSGGAVYLDGGTFALTAGTIKNNTANDAFSGGGAVYVHGGSFDMSGGTIKENTAKSGGGGVYVFSGNFTMSNGGILENTANSSGLAGSGVYLRDCNMQLSGSAKIGGGSTENTVALEWKTRSIVTDSALTGSGTAAVIELNHNSGYKTGRPILSGSAKGLNSNKFEIKKQSCLLGGKLNELEWTLDSEGKLKRKPITSWGQLTQAVALASEDETIELSQDLTRQDGDSDIVLKTYITGSRTVTIKSNDTAQNRTLDANRKGRVFDIGSASNLTLENLTIKGGQVSDDGGGIRAVGIAGNDYFLKLTNCIVEDNHTKDFSQNHGHGAGLYVTDMRLELTGCTIKNNEVKQQLANSGFGGGLALNGLIDGSFITGGEISANISNEGGGISVGRVPSMTSSRVSKLTITGTEIHNNTSHHAGGGLSDSGGSGVNNIITLKGIKMYQNTADLGDKRGGGISVWQGTVTLDKDDSDNPTLIYDNTADGRGGGISVDTKGKLIINKATVSGNHSSGNGAGIYFKTDGDGFVQMSGDAKVGGTYDTGTGTLSDSNYIWLGSGKKIDITGNLTADAANPAAAIVPENYPTVGAPVTVLGAASTGLINSNCTKFKVKNEVTSDNPTGKWSINKDGMLVMPEQTLDFTDPAAPENDRWKKLKEAVAHAASEGTITINGTIKATSDGEVSPEPDDDNFGEIKINKKLTIIGGTGAVINANCGEVSSGHTGKNHRIFKIESGGSLTIENLTLKGGAVASGNGAGVLVLNGGSLTMNNGSTITGNTGKRGAGVYVGGGGTFTMNNGSTITGNTASYSGGGVEVSGGGGMGTITMNDGSSITGNTVTGTMGGGGVYIGGGTLNMYGGTISGNMLTKTTSKGNGVFGGGKFIMKGNAKVGGGGKNNMVYLGSGAIITIGGNLSATADNPAATIAPASYPTGGTPVTVLGDDSTGLIGSNYTKFKVKDNGSEKWAVNDVGTLLKIPNPPLMKTISVTPTGGISTSASEGSTSNPVADTSHVRYKGVFIKDRRVKLSAYTIAETEVTYKLWREVYNWAITNGYTFANAGQAGSKGATATAGNALPEDSTYANHPVTSVSWRDCIVWCNAYTEMTKGKDACVYQLTGQPLRNAKDTTNIDAVTPDMSKKGYRLPTEAEWEYAARYQGSDSANAVHYGSSTWLTKLNSCSGATDNFTVSGAFVNFAIYGRNPTSGSTAAVKTKTRNDLNLYDMSGNVHEWCFDRYHDNAAQGDGVPLGNLVSNPMGATGGSQRVYRGGCWNNDAKTIVLGYRFMIAPQTINSGIGFRLAQSK